MPDKNCKTCHGLGGYPMCPECKNADDEGHCISLSGSRLAELANEWDRKGWMLDVMANDRPEERERIQAKAGVFRSVAVDLRRALKEENVEDTLK